MKRQFLATHTILQTEIPALLDSCVTNTPLSKCCVHKKNCLYLFVRKSITCLHVGLLRIGQVFSVSCKIVYQWVTTYCSFMSIFFCRAVRCRRNALKLCPRGVCSVFGLSVYVAFLSLSSQIPKL